ncbi:MAG TPA: HU family DNA-binding protein [Bryobacteraceae bacterium]|nr:HU family DNA-binding protein [Bryobacteraceae bacterium]
MYRKKDIAKRLAGKLHVSPEAAADQVDRAVDEILRKVRQGKNATLPGIGVLGPAERPVRARRGRRP